MLPVFIKLEGDLSFAKRHFRIGDLAGVTGEDVADFAGRVSSELGWGVQPTQVALFLVPENRVSYLEKGGKELECDFANRLSTSSLCETVLKLDKPSHVLARTPATAQGKHTLSHRTQPAYVVPLRFLQCTLLRGHSRSPVRQFQIPVCGHATRLVWGRRTRRKTLRLSPLCLFSPLHFVPRSLFVQLLHARAYCPFHRTALSTFKLGVMCSASVSALVRGRPK
jgi:hypothetical protein